MWKSILNRSAGVVAISNSIESWLLDRMKIKNRNIKVIHYGINLKIREKIKLEIKTKIQLEWQQESFLGKALIKL